MSLRVETSSLSLGARGGELGPGVVRGSPLTPGRQRCRVSDETSELTDRSEKVSLTEFVRNLRHLAVHSSAVTKLNIKSRQCSDTD